MAARLQFVIRNFALHPNRAEFCLKRTADASRQLKDGKNLRRLLKEIRCQLHSIYELTTHIVQSAEFILFRGIGCRASV
jgi:hypothetical protein